MTRVRVSRSMGFILLLALVVQGLIFSLHASEKLNGQKSPVGIWEKPCYEQAKQYVEKGSIDKAIPGLKKIAGLYPDNLEVHAYLGWAYSQKGFISDAVEEFQKVLEINPNLQREPFGYPMTTDVPSVVKEFTENFEDLIDWVDELSGAHAVLGLCYVQQGRLGDALNEYKRVLNLEHSYGKRDAILGGKEIISVIDQAIKEYEDVLRLKPDCGEAYIKLACAHAEKGELDMAIADMKKVISLEPRRVEAYVFLGCFYAKKEMLDDALHELREAKKIREAILEKLLAETERCINNGIFDKAISAAQDALSVSSKNKKAYWLLATAYSKNDETEKAIELCREIIGMYPDDIEAYVFLGWIYIQCDLIEEAKYLIERAICREPDNAEILALMAFLYASENQVNEAVAMCNMAVNKISGKNDRVNDYGWVRGKVSSIEQKFREVLDVLEIKSDYPEAYLCLGWLYSKDGEHEQAITAFKKVLELTPDSYKAHVYLGNAYVQKGRIKDALNEYTKALGVLSGNQFLK